MSNRHFKRRSFEQVTIELIILFDTCSDILVAKYERSDGVWLPRSQVEIEMIGNSRKRARVSMPSWLAQEEGLI
jgi:hypothetical protein